MPYTDGAKHEMLGVDADLLARVGAVSKEVAEAMATGALAASKAEVALSITGYADKNGDGAPGLVFFGLASGGAATSVEERHFGDIGRAAVRIACLSTGLMLIGKRIGALHPRPR